MKAKVVKNILNKIAAPPTPPQAAQGDAGSPMLLGSVLYNSPDFQKFVFDRLHRTPEQLDSNTREKVFSEFAAGLNQPTK